jgi:DNA mismatch repair protein MutS
LLVLTGFYDYHRPPQEAHFTIKIADTGNPMEATSNLTPMLKQYFDLKQEAQDAVVFFRMGDFYEIFGADAEDIAPKLDVVLTAREKGDQTKIPFCGVPHHAATSYWVKLVKLGYKVAIVEQLEEATATKGLVKRGIVRTYTPGVLDELEGLERNEPNYLCAVLELPSNRKMVLLACDMSTGEMRLGYSSAEQIIYDLRKFRPKEILVRRYAMDSFKAKLLRESPDNSYVLSLLPEAVLKDSAEQKALYSHVFGQIAFEQQPCGPIEEGSAVVAATLTYIKGLQATLSSFLRIDPLVAPESMILSDNVIRDLELFETSRRRQADGSLAKTIDRTLTPMGARQLRYAICHPFANVERIKQRQNLVRECVHGGEHFLVAIREHFKHVSDLSRLTTRVLSGAASPSEVALIRQTLQGAEVIAGLLQNTAKNGVFKTITEALQDANLAMTCIDQALEEVPGQLGFGKNVFRTGFDKELDQKVQLASNGENEVEQYEQKLRQETGISSLKIKEHKTFGLLVEVTKSNLNKVPASFIRRQTMVNCERFGTAELLELGEALVNASGQAIAREQELFHSLLQKIASFKENLMRVAQALAELDLVQGLAWIAIKEHWCKPEFVTSKHGNVIIKGGRHPVVERFVGRHQFVANDVVLNRKQSHLLITGPNMAGKSTIMRQTAVIALLAQIGAYVPAKEAELIVFDRIFTRVGAADDLSRGQSTFMVEMSEAAEILRLATSQSLVILDEVGRGTSTADGLALARAILEDLVDRIGCYTMFATHYHELVPMMSPKGSVVAVQTETIQKEDHSVFFSHRLIPGASGTSFGIEVAKLAGLPSTVIARAHGLLSSVQTQSSEPTHTTHHESKPVAQAEASASVPKEPRPGVSKVQRDLFGLEMGDLTKSESPTEHLQLIAQKLEAIKIHRTTPLQALNHLDDLKRMLVPTQQKSLFPDMN